jgi:SAM-dependent methyltransferase
MDQGVYRCISRLRDGARCSGSLQHAGHEYRCPQCDAAYPVRENVPIFRATPIDHLLQEGDYDRRDRRRELCEGMYEPERSSLRRWIDALGLTGPSLDVGCGNGLLEPVLPGYHGLEYNLVALLDPGWDNQPRACGDAQELPFADGYFRIIASVNVFEHIPQIDLLYAELDRVLAPGGTMLLRPAWHSLRAYTQALPIRPYRELDLRQKLTKALLPLTMSRPYKLATRVPSRVVRRLTTHGPQPMKWTRLTPWPHPRGKYSLPKWLPDTDAESCIDPHETILYFTRRGYRCLSHPRVMKQILAGHDLVVLQKPHHR